MITFREALLSLQPLGEWSVNDNDINQISWLNTSIPQPTKEQIEAEIVRLQAEYDANEYQRKRVREYPPITDYLDGVVKGNQAQIDKYIADCLAVKEKYPK